MSQAGSTLEKSEKDSTHSNNTIGVVCSRYDAKWDWTLGIVCLVVVILAFSFDLNESSSVTAGGWQLPSVCTFRNMTGIDCPGCGLTRGFVAISHGQIASAWNYNPASFLWFGVIAFQIPFRGMRLWRYYRARKASQTSADTDAQEKGRQSKTPFKSNSQFWTVITLGGLGIILIVQWIVRLSLRL